MFWSCQQSIRGDHFLCYDHYLEFQDGLIDECPGCGLAKGKQYDVCLDCYDDSALKTVRFTPSRGQRWYKEEYSPAWEAQDATAERFFVYILKLSNGSFYAGQTRELRERLYEHRGGRGAKTTAGKNPKLVWYSVVPTRDAATKLEVELKQLVDSNPREITRMVVSFQDLQRELDYS